MGSLNNMEAKGLMLAQGPGGSCPTCPKGPSYTNVYQGRQEPSRYFEGVPVYQTPLARTPFTTPWSINLPLGDHYLNDIPLLRHEFGHILHYRRHGLGMFLVVAVVSPISVMSDGEHQDTWTERAANTLSYLYFGMPSDWNHSNPKGDNYYPIDWFYFVDLLINR